MKPHTIINQTLYSYCKEQYEFNIQPMFINLTEWPSGFIYSDNPYEKFDNDDRDYEECTMELRGMVGDQIRLVFYSMETNSSDDYEQDYNMPISKSPCLKIRDNDEIINYNCLLLSSASDQYKSTEYLSSSNVIYLELLPPSFSIHGYDDHHANQFQFFFHSFFRKSHSVLCPSRSSFDCGDSSCVHSNSRCNAIDECRTKLDEKFCSNSKSNSWSIYSQAFYSFFFYALTHGQSLF